jgi:hypothetical protein
MSQQFDFCRSAGTPSHVIGLDQRGAVVLRQKGVARPDRSRVSQYAAWSAWSPVLGRIIYPARQV